jgi:hypothetical protein
MSTPWILGGWAMKITTAFTILLLLLSAAMSNAAQPKQETLQAWEDHIRDVKASMENRAKGNCPFLWIDESPEMMQRVKSGEVVVTSHDPGKVPQGMIHHWVGAMFIPNVTFEQAMKVLSNYDRYNDFYKPLITKSVVVEREGDNAKVSVLAVQKVFSVTAAVETDNQVQVVRLNSEKAYIMSDALRVQEIADYGQPGEHPFPEDRRPGYVWRSFVLQRVEQRDGGVYIEVETIALSRGIPLEFRWLIKPVTDQLPRKLMLETLSDTRTAVQHEAQSYPSSGQQLSESR